MICNVEITSEIFSELNDKHIHTYKNEGITNRVSGSLGACMCLSNTYTSHTQHVHISCTKTYFCADSCSLCKFTERDDPCMCLAFNSKKKMQPERLKY